METGAPRPYRVFEAVVEAVEDLSPHLRRFRFGGPELHAFADPGADTRIKLLFPTPCHQAGERLTLGPEAESDWYAAWLGLDDRLRPQMRTYTTRRVLDTPAGRAVDVDIVVHPPSDLRAAAEERGGPAADWAASARSGDRILLVGPDARWEGCHRGRAFAPPPDTSAVVLVGDETALPAIARILEDLDDCDGDPVRVFVEVPTCADLVGLRAPEGTEVTWLPRGQSARGAALGSAVRAWVADHLGDSCGRSATAPPAAGAPSSGASDETTEEDAVWDVPDEMTGVGHGGLYVWVAAESGVVRNLRRHLVADLGVPRERVASMGYWKLGACG